jgi:error-prone DNA polymerase
MPQSHFSQVGDFTPPEADQLRRAMGAKRSSEKMERLKDRLYEGMARNGITGDLADTIFLRLRAFSNYGFPVLFPNRHLSEPQPTAA